MRRKDERKGKSADPGTKQEIDETHSSCGSVANLAGGMTLSMYSISSVSSCLSACHLRVLISREQPFTDLSTGSFGQASSEQHPAYEEIERHDVRELEGGVNELRELETPP
jgi:hypothetical protein